MALGRCDFFTMLMIEGCYFYHVNGFWGAVSVDFSSMFELARFGQSVIYIITPHAIVIVHTECI